MFFFGLAGFASAIITVSAAYIYPALVLGSMERHDPDIEHAMKTFGSLLVILALWVGLLGAYRATLPVGKTEGH